MTCIVAMRSKRVVLVGADSLGSSGDFTILRSDRKVFRNGSYTIAGCGSYRAIDVMRYADLPKPPRSGNAHRFMCVDFVDSVRKSFENAGLMRKDNEVQSAYPFIVAFGRNIFELDSDFQVGINHDGFIAMGSGREVASGALWATRNMKLSPEKRIRLAIGAASHFNSGVGGPIHVMSTQ